jgi:hypothetical protein
MNRVKELLFEHLRFLLVKLLEDKNVLQRVNYAVGLLVPNDVIADGWCY